MLDLIPENRIRVAYITWSGFFFQSKFSFVFNQTVIAPITFIQNSSSTLESIVPRLSLILDQHNQ